MLKIQSNYLILFLLGITVTLTAQADRWQQRVEYNMDINFDVKKHQFTGKQKLVYYNNSPDELNKVFYHLYFNAFQPNSMMDVRSRTIMDPSPKIGGKIEKLGPNEVGYHRVKSLTQNGKPLSYEVVGTILEVTLNEPIVGGGKATFDMEFESQVPVQIRRSGRDNAEGISYSMSQWYPKMAEYDYQGWHANPYIGREFHGVWGDFDVKITIDKKYIVAAGGYIQNPEEVGNGYEDENVEISKKQKRKRKKSKTLTYHFKAPNVHDFMWAADPDYVHEKLKTDEGVLLHFFYQPGGNTTEVWKKLPAAMNTALTFMNKNYGEYPYKEYFFIQGGDGGMEYPMGTLITGERPLSSLVGVSVHEWMHSWYQMVLATNEALYGWMDEGFTSYGSAATMNHLRREQMIPGKSVADPHLSSYIGYNNIALSGYEEPLITHADHFKSNQAYGVASYVKGAVFLHQLQYIIGKEAFEKGMLSYFDTWKFKHPNSNDFIRIMEKESGLELDWYREYWVNTTEMIDYGVKSVDEADGKSTKLTLEKVGVMPMPLDIMVTYKGGRQEVFNIPLRIMRGAKQKPSLSMGFTVKEDWPWTHPTYELVIPRSKEEIQSIEIDPFNMMADVNRTNNVYSTVKN